MTLKTFSLFLQAVLLVAQWMRDRKAAGVARDEALKELTDALNARIRAAADARARPHDGGVRDPYDRG